MIRIVLRLCLILLAIFTSIILGELYLRFNHPQSTIDNVRSFYDYRCYQALPYYFIGLKPNSNCTFKSNDNAFEPYTVRVNQFGLRGSQISEVKPKDTKRILFVGDSFTFGLGVKEQDIFTKVVERNLNQNMEISVILSC